MLDIGLSPEIIRNGKNIYLLSLSQIQVRFIRINNYLSGSEYDLCKQFNIPFKPLYFPEKFLVFENQYYDGQIPDINLFLNFSDSLTVRNQKIKFVEDFKEQWNCKNELLKFTTNKIKLLTQACTKFLKDCLNLQNLLQTDPEKKFINPFGIGLCTIASFTYKLYKCFYLNNYPIYSIHNEFNNDGKEISQQEAEWAAYYTFKFPELNYFSSLGHPKGQKYFSEAIPDLYSPVSKEAKFYCGCFWHGHYGNCLLNPNAGPTTRNQVSKKTYFELSADLHRKTSLLLQNNPTEIHSISIEW